jgi:hypothetical protein
MLTLNKTVPSKVQVNLSGDGDVFDEDTKRRIEEARKAGVPEPQIQMEATEYQARKNPIIKQTDTSKVADLLPLIGAVGGSFIPGLGTIVGSAVGAGLGTAMKQEAKKEPFNAKEIGKETLYAGAGGVVGKGIGYVGGKVLGKLAPKVAEAGGEATSKTGLLPKIGKSVREFGESMKGTSKIRVKASVSAPREEEAIRQTFKNLKLEGPANELYKQLEPNLNFLEKNILGHAGMSNKKVPATVIYDSFKKGVRDNILTGNLDEVSAKKAIDGVLKDLMKRTGKEGNLAELSTEDLLSWKRIINKQYSGISKKIDAGTALTPKEQVLEQAWNSIDEALRSVNPEISGMLSEQSNLYKSLHSIDSASRTVPTMRMAGTSIPAKIANNVSEKSGKFFENVGTGIEKMSAGGTLPPINVDPVKAQKVLGALPTIGAGVGAGVGSMEQVGDGLNYGGSENNQVEDSQQVEGQQDDSNHANQYITGYSPEQLFQAVMTAQQAGDTKSATMLKGWYEAELKYQEGGSEKAVPATIKAKQDLSTAGLRARQDAEDIFKENPSIVLTGLLTGGLASRKFDSALSRAIEGLLRARSGAAVPDSEVAKYKKDYGPRIGDTRETALYKLKQLELDLMDVFNGQAVPDQLPVIQ